MDEIKGIPIRQSVQSNWFVSDTLDKDKRLIKRFVSQTVKRNIQIGDRRYIGLESEAEFTNGDIEKVYHTREYRVLEF